MQRVEEEMRLKLRAEDGQLGARQPRLELCFPRAAGSEIAIVQDRVQYTDKQREYQEVRSECGDRSMSPTTLPQREIASWRARPSAATL